MDEINNDSELELDLDTEEVEKKPRRDQRVDNALSAKAKAEELAAKEAKAREKAEREAEVAKKDLEFFKTFNTASSKYQGAADYQDQIKEKVAKGYDLEDAIVSTLTKEGKYTPPPLAPTPKESPAGGSATTTLRTGSEKPVSEMTQEEIRAKLVEAETRGDIALN